MCDGLCARSLTTMLCKTNNRGGDARLPMKTGQAAGVFGMNNTLEMGFSTRCHESVLFEELTTD